MLYCILEDRMLFDPYPTEYWGGGGHGFYWECSLSMIEDDINGNGECTKDDLCGNGPLWPRRLRKVWE